MYHFAISKIHHEVHNLDTTSKKEQNTLLDFLFQQTHTIHPGNQKNDYLEIYDGLNEQANRISKLNGNLESFSISSTENFLFIKFETFYAQFGGFIATINYGKHKILMLPCTIL